MVPLLIGLLLVRPPQVFLSEAQALQLAFPGAERVEKKLVALTPDERATVRARSGGREAPRIFRYWIGRKDGIVVGYAAIDDVLGKSQPITYMVAVDPTLHIRAVEILAYRESHGGEVRQAGWRSQFAGRDASSPLRVGADIHNIAGATISCRAVTDGVRLQLACLAAVVEPSAREGRSTPAGSSSSVPEGGDGVPVLVRRVRLLMGTTLEIRAWAPDTGAGGEAIESAFDEVARLELILSSWREDSEVARMNRAAGGDPLPASPDLLDLLARSIEASKLTGGAFDVTIGPLVELWRSAGEKGVLPSEEEIRGARERTGFPVIETDRDHGRARLVRPGCAVDFGGIGKGYALDRAGGVLEGRGVHGALLNFGGQILALDPPPGEPSWTVDVRDPARPDRMLTSVRLARASLACTADYERGLAIGGRRFSHVVDPRTGRPVEGMLGAVVVCSTATEADALSTALYVLGEEAGSRLARERALAVLIAASGRPLVRTDAFRALEVPREEER